jgi:chromate transporter
MYSQTKKTNITLIELFKTFGSIGLINFGGPAGQIALMHREIVDEKQWIDDDDFLHALNFCHFLPGPEAQQLATYIGWRLHGILGGLIAGLLFIIPGALIVLSMSILYAFAANIEWFQAVFMGIKSAVIAIILQALIRISKKSLKSKIDILIAISAFVGLYFFNIEFPIIIFCAALAGIVNYYFNRNQNDKVQSTANQNLKENIIKSLIQLAVWGLVWALPFVLIYTFLGKDNIFWDIALFFSKLAIVTFGGAYAVLAYMAQEAVQTFGWLSSSDMANGLALAESTPGPLILVTQFVGFLAAFKESAPFSPFFGGLFGAMITTWVTFAPCFLWIFVFAPWVEVLKSAQIIKSALNSISAAIVGIIANLSLWFAIHAIFASNFQFDIGIAKFLFPNLISIDWKTILITGFAILGLFRFKIGIIKLLGVCSFAGLLTQFLN